MLYRIIGRILDSIYRLVCGRQKTKTFQRLDLSPSSCGLGQDKPTQFGPLERATPVIETGFSNGPS
jgi:hypothetical protein